MLATERIKREKQIQFAVGMAALDGGKPTTFTQQLLDDYKKGRITSGQLKKPLSSNTRKCNSRWIHRFTITKIE